MMCGLNCGGCAIDPDDGEQALDQPIPEQCPQVFFAGGIGEFMAFIAYPGNDARCVCGNVLDEDGLCRVCTNEQAFADEAVASERSRTRSRAHEDVHDSPSKGPEG